MNAQIHSMVEQAAELAKNEWQRTAAKLEGVVEAKRQLERLELSLQAEMKQHKLTVNLKRSGRFCWKDLNDSNKWKKENVLAVFVSGRIPAEFTERLWYQTAPESIQNDKEILMARVAQKDFQKPFLASGQPFRMPAELLKDKPTLIAVLNQCPEVLGLHGIPGEFFNDVEVFRAYLRSTRPFWRSIFDFDESVGKFSAGIRGNADLMLEAAKQGFLKGVGRHLEESLRDDCCFATRLSATAAFSYSFVFDSFSERVRANPEVVLACVRRNGRYFFDAAESLHGNQEIVRAACLNCTYCAIEILLSAAGPVRQQLGQDRDFMMGIFAKLYNECGRRDEQRGAGRLFRMLSENMKLDRDVLVAANRCGSLSFSDIPASLSDDPGFWLDMIRRDSSFWFGLPINFEQDPAFAWAIEDFESVLLMQAVFQRFPALSLDRNVWFKIIASELKLNYTPWDEDNCSQLSIVIRDHIPEQFRLDRELMLCACSRQVDVLLQLDPTFDEDRDLFRAALETDTFPSLDSMRFNPQLLHPDLLIEAISKDEVLEIDAVAPELWSNLNIWKAWADCGGPYHSTYPDDWKSSPEFGLLILKCDSDNIANAFMEATTETLRSNKSFMLKAVELNAEALVCARGGLQQDFDVVIAAFGGGEYRVQCLANNLLSSDRWDAKRPFLRRILNEAEQYLEAHDGFSKAFVHGMTALGASCHLSMLANDKATSLALKQKIAAYLGVPVGKDLCIVRQAVARLSALVPVED